MFASCDLFIVIRCVLLLQFGFCLAQSSLKFTVNEEKDVGYVVGNINEYVITNFNEYKYEVSLINNYFSITPKKNLTIKKKIDLEKLCNDANLCCRGSQCIIPATVLISSANSRTNQLIIDIEVLDINDNIPTFKNAIQSVDISESSKLGTQIAVECGADNDVSQANQIQQYKFEETTKTFILDSTDMASLSLVLQKQIDYERQKVYHAKLEACDNDTRCVLQPIIINVLDENDNLPMFQKSRYEVEIPEDFDIGKVVISARAVDLDGAQFNKTKYGLYNNRDPNLARKFRINENNGDIILTSKLSALQGLKYEFKIYAMETGRYLAGKKNYADVVIYVKDINNNRPIIELFQSKRITNDKETFEMKILENERPQKLMSMKVSDADLDLNAKVTCDLKDPSLSLELKYIHPGVYEINSIRSFDYEQETQIKARFECKDSGVPPLSSYKSIKINIDDVNEYSPEFEQSEFHSSIKENTGPGETVLTVRANDKDGAAVLVYSIEENATPYFAINPTTGVIKSASISFDREQTSVKTFRVTVTDSMANPRSADAMVRISILDENDNDPVFVPSSLQFFISENEPLKSKLQGQLRANDMDKDDSNSYISFSLVDTFDSHRQKCDESHFLIKFNGEIETLSMLDRELNANFTLTVEAKDKGKPPRFTRANATVIVHDVNDNAPMWIYPRPTDYLPGINLTENVERFHLIIKLKAHDPDSAEAGRISYLLVNHHDTLFSVNDTNGELRTDRSPLPYGQYQLQLRATDHGTPARNSDTMLLINVSDSGKLSNVNLTIIIGMVGITALISIFLIVAIICVRRRPRFHQSYLSPSTDVSKEQSNHYFPHNQWMYNPADDSVMPPLSDNESCIYLPTNFYDQQDPLIIQSMTGSRPVSRLDYPLVLPSSHHLGGSDHKYNSSQNAERTNGTLRSNNGLYCSLNTPGSGIVINGQELDGDSADSGKGASEVDLRLQYHLNNATRNYPTMPMPHHSTATTTFGYQSNINGPQYFSTNPNSKLFDSRCLTVHPSSYSSRRVMSPTFNASSNQCQCFMLPEDDVIQMGHDNNQVPFTTFLKSSSSSSSSNHNHNCVFRDDMMMPPGAGYYPHYPCVQATTSRVSQSPIQTKDSMVNNQDMRVDIRENDQMDMYDGKQTNNYSSDEQLNQDSNMYTIGLAN